MDDLTLDADIYDPACTPCVLTLPHAHPDGRPPLWPCRHCHNAQHDHCDSTTQFCVCHCGIEGDL